MCTDRMTLDSYAKIKLWEDGPNYQKVVKYVNNSQCHPNTKLTVVNIHRVWLHSREDENLCHISNRKLLWHGTKRANIPHILSNGFKLPAHAGQMFGSGIYFADRISKSSNYSDLDVTFLLLCEVGLGKVYSCKKSHNDWKSVPGGFDSVKANGTFVPDWTDNARYCGAEIPFGRTVKCTKYESHAVNFNEFIVYDPKRVIIRFLVEVKVEKLLIPTPLMITPKNVAPKNKATGKSSDAYAAHKKNQQSRIKTIYSNPVPAPSNPTSVSRITQSNGFRLPHEEYPAIDNGQYLSRSHLISNAPVYQSSSADYATQSKEQRNTCTIL